MAEKQNTPEIRFEGFADPWEQRKLGELCEVKDSARVPNSLWGESGIPYIRASDLSNNNMNGALFLSPDTFDFYSTLTGNPVKGDVLFNGGGEIGKAHLLTEKSQVYVQGGAVLYARTSESQSLDGQFLEVAFESNEVRSYIEVAAAGGTMKHFTLGPARTLPLCVPCMPEQQAIGTLFSRLDNLITLHQRKYDKLCTVKKSMLDKMFPKPGETEPEIRFEGFTDPWEQRKLGEFSKQITTKNADGGLSETFTNSAEQGVISQLDYFDHDITNNANISGYYVVQPDNFVYNPRISVTAPCGPINRNRLNRAGVMSPLYTVFSVDESVDKAYLEHYFKTSRWHDFMFLEGNSGARSDRFSISDATFFEMPIWCPKIPEQRAIAKQLETTDSLITLHQRKLGLLRNIKKSLLDRMFV